MSYEVKLKTGFYETTVCELSVAPGFIRLIPQGDAAGEAIQISQKDVTAIVFTVKKHAVFEIQTRDQVFTGIFLKDSDLEALGRELRKNMNKKIVYEEP